MKISNNVRLLVVLMAVYTIGGCSNGGGDSDPALISFTLLTGDGGRVAWYTGTAEHERVAFDRVVDEVTANMELYTMQPDGTDVTDLTGTNDTVPEGFVGQPEWHPDGEYIIFQVENANSQGMRFNHVSWGINNDLWIIKKDGTGAEKIWETPLNHAALHPHFNADGTKIIFAERQSTGEILYSPLLTPGGQNPWAGWRIHIADFDISQTGTARLSNHVTLFDAELPKDRGFFETHGFVDADTIIFSRTLGGQAYVDDVFTSELDGNNLVNLTQSPATWEEHGLYSPSGNSLCFISSRVNSAWQAPVDTAATLRTELYMQQDGVITQLTEFNADGDIDYRYLVSDYEWDRTGQRIVFQVAPVDDVTGTAYSPEIWLLTFPEVP
jgi:Tol biopolymer transport system component